MAETALNPDRFWLVRQANGESGWWLCTSEHDAEYFAESDNFEIRECAALPGGEQPEVPRAGEKP